MATKKIQINELKEIIRKEFLAQMNEATKFTATRRLTILARKASMDFESEIVKELGLADPDSMDEQAQKIYYHAMKKLEASFISAVVDAVKEVENLPKEEDEDGEPKATAIAAPEVKQVPTVPGTVPGTK